MTSANIGGSGRKAIKAIRNDARPECVMIDRVLKSMLDATGFDLHGLVRILINQGYYYDPSLGPTMYAWEEVGDQLFMLHQEGSDAPVLSTSVSIGCGIFTGNEIVVDELFPDTLCAAVVGRRLDTFISTGLPPLDRRPILAVNSSFEGWPQAPTTRVRFDPDLTFIG